MASRIDTSDIDINYPVAGIDNDSQGFRTNFDEIKKALDDAALDIDALHEFVGVPTTVTDTLAERVAALETSVDAIDVTGLAADVTAAEANVATLVTDVNTLEDRIADVDHPPIFTVEQSSDPTTASDVSTYLTDPTYSVSMTLDYENGKHQVINTSGLAGYRQITITNFGPETENRAARMTIEIVQGADNQRFGLSSTGVSLYKPSSIAHPTVHPAVGVSGDRHIFELMSRDGGDTIYVLDYKLLTATV